MVTEHTADGVFTHAVGGQGSTYVQPALTKTYIALPKTSKTETVITEHTNDGVYKHVAPGQGYIGGPRLFLDKATRLDMHLLPQL